MHSIAVYSLLAKEIVDFDLVAMGIESCAVHNNTPNTCKSVLLQKHNAYGDTTIGLQLWNLVVLAEIESKRVQEEALWRRFCESCKVGYK